MTANSSPYVIETIELKIANHRALGQVTSIYNDYLNEFITFMDEYDLNDADSFKAVLDDVTNHMYSAYSSTLKEHLIRINSQLLDCYIYGDKVNYRPMSLARDFSFTKMYGLRLHPSVIYKDYASIKDKSFTQHVHDIIATPKNWKILTRCNDKIMRGVVEQRNNQFYLIVDVPVFYTLAHDDEQLDNSREITYNKFKADYGEPANDYKEFSRIVGIDVGSRYVAACYDYTHKSSTMFAWIDMHDKQQYARTAYSKNVHERMYYGNFDFVHEPHLSPANLVDSDREKLSKIVNDAASTILERIDEYVRSILTESNEPTLFVFEEHVFNTKYLMYTFMSSSELMYYYFVDRFCELAKKTQHSVMFIDGANTSTDCPQCGHRDASARKVNMHIYICSACGFFENDDITAAMNLARRVSRELSPYTAYENQFETYLSDALASIRKCNVPGFGATKSDVTEYARRVRGVIDDYEKKFTDTLSEMSSLESHGDDALL